MPRQSSGRRCATVLDSIKAGLFPLRRKLVAVRLELFSERLESAPTGRIHMARSAGPPGLLGVLRQSLRVAREENGENEQHRGCRADDKPTTEQNVGNEFERHDQLSFDAPPPAEPQDQHGKPRLSGEVPLSAAPGMQFLAERPSTAASLTPARLLARRPVGSRGQRGACKAAPVPRGKRPTDSSGGPATVASTERRATRRKDLRAATLAWSRSNDTVRRAGRSSGDDFPA